jgi:hypothetical protein
MNFHQNQAWAASPTQYLATVGVAPETVAAGLASCGLDISNLLHAIKLLRRARWCNCLAAACLFSPLIIGATPQLGGFGMLAPLLTAPFCYISDSETFRLLKPSHLHVLPWSILFVDIRNLLLVLFDECVVLERLTNSDWMAELTMQILFHRYAASLPRLCSIRATELELSIPARGMPLER